MKPEWLFLYCVLYSLLFASHIKFNLLCCLISFLYFFLSKVLGGFLNFNCNSKLSLSLSLRSLRSQSKEPPVYQSSPMKKGIYASLCTHLSLVWISLYSRCPSMKWLGLPHSLFIKMRVHFVRCIIPQEQHMWVTMMNRVAWWQRELFCPREDELVFCALLLFWSFLFLWRTDISVALRHLQPCFSNTLCLRSV